MRAMASVRRIDAIHPIPDADAIEVAVVGGWNVVIKKGDFRPDDLAVYCEIDSWIPHSLAPFLSKGQEPREYNGVKGERLRTVRLRKQLSQGLLLPLTAQMLVDCGAPEGTSAASWEGVDVSEALDIQKWELPVNAQLAGVAKGNFPDWIPKTDQERVQNLKRQLETWKHLSFEVTEKLEGSSMTCYLKDGVFGVCSRNIDLKETEGNTFWAAARKYDIEAKMRFHGMEGYAIQGELVGPGIQGNIYGLIEHQFYVFDIFDDEWRKYFIPESRHFLVSELKLLHAPVLDYRRFLPLTLEEVLAQAEGKSKMHSAVQREGEVWKSNTSDDTFKAISNAYLLKQK